jgi:alpha-ribazole phosphatase
VTLWLVRHAMTLAPPGTCYGRLDDEAEASATLQAARALAGVLPIAIRLRCSPARRCRLLADALAALRPDLADIMCDDRLQEMDFGSWEGRAWEAIGEPAMTAWTSDFARHAPGGGETVQALLARVAAALDGERASRADAVWITHAGVVRATRLLATGARSVASAADWPAGEVPFGGWETVELDGAAVSVRSPAPASRA